MKRLMGLIGIVAAFVAFSAFSAPANADGFGLHFAGHGHYGDPYYSGYRAYKVGYGYGGHDCYGDSGAWHDTSHYDYHPGEFVRHRGHFHYVPGHYDFHDTGHWDHYGW